MPEVSSNDLARILKIGHDTSMRGEGISLREAIRRTNYVDLRRHFDFRDLVPMLEANPELIREWVFYSEDK